jgi:hypothetical protein
MIFALHFIVSATTGQVVSLSVSSSPLDIEPTRFTLTSPLRVSTS